MPWNLACSMIDGSRAARALSRLSCGPCRTKSAPISATLDVQPVTCGDQRMCPRSPLRLQRIAAKSTQIAIATRCVYFGWFVSLGAPEVTLPPDACIWVGLSLGPPDACILGRFVVGRCVVGRARSDPAPPPPPPQPARCVYLGWFCPRSGIDLIHYLRRKRLQLTGVRWYEMVI